MAEDNQQKQRRITPSNELDLHYLVIEPSWYNNIPYDLKEKLTKYKKVLYNDENGEEKEVIDENALYSILGMYQKDIRLGFLSSNPWNDELAVVREYLYLASRCLNKKCYQSFVQFLSDTATIIDTSQSKGGFLRKQMNTFRQENISALEEPPKKSLFGGGKQKEF